MGEPVFVFPDGYGVPSPTAPLLARQMREHGWVFEWSSRDESDAVRLMRAQQRVELLRSRFPETMLIDDGAIASVWRRG